MLKPEKLPALASRSASALAMVFLGLSFLYPILSFVFIPGFQINLWLGLFNMIPFGNFDGIKILHWNRYLWSGMVAFGVYFLFIF